MKVGDTVEVLTPGALFPKDVLGKVNRIAGDRVVVCFPGNWRVYYLPDQIRVVDSVEEGKEVRMAQEATARAVVT